MPIDDALKEIDGNEKKKEGAKSMAKTNLTYIKPWHENIIMSYIRYISKCAEADHATCDPAVVGLYGPWIRFDETLSGVIAPVPKSQVMEIFLNCCPAHIKQLMEHTDLKEYLEKLPSTVDVHKIDSDYNIPGWMKIVESLGRKHFFVFEHCAQSFRILDLNQLSLFIAEGEKLRDYARFTGHQDKVILDLTDASFGMHFDFGQFNAEALLAFCQATGTKKIKKTLDDACTLLKDLQKLYEEAREMTMGAGSSAKDGITSYLFERLQKYNPELVLKERQDTIEERKADDPLDVLNEDNPF